MNPRLRNRVQAGLYLIAFFFAAYYTNITIARQAKISEEYPRQLVQEKVAPKILPAQSATFKRLYTSLLSRDIPEDSVVAQISYFPDAAVEKIILQAMILKRHSSYQEMFATLSREFYSEPPYYSYYDELVFSAAATGNLHRLDSLVKRRYISESTLYSNYTRGILLQTQARYAEAIEFFKKTTALEGESLQPILRLATCYVTSGKGELALNVLESNKTKLEVEPYPASMMLLLKGVVYFTMAEFTKAESSYTGALTISKREGFLDIEARSLVNLGILFDQKGELDIARGYFKDAARKARTINDKYSLGLACSELGVSYSFANEIPEAIVQYKRAISEYSLIKDNYRLSLAYANTGYAYVSLGDWSSAKDIFEKGLSFAQGSPRAYCLNAIGLADIYSNSGNYSEALKHYESAKKKILDAKIYDLQSKLNLSVSGLSYNIGRYNSAVQLITETVEGEHPLESTPDDLTKLFRQMGLAYYAMDSVKEAETYFALAKDIAQIYSLADDLFRLLVDESVLRIETGDLKGATSSLAFAAQFQEERTLNDRLYYEMVELQLANKTGSIASFEKHSRAGEMLANGNIHPETKAGFLFEEANYFDKTNQVDKASANYIAAITLLENVSSTLLSYQKLHLTRRSATFDLYRKVIEFFISHGKYETAFTILDHARAKNSFYAISESFSPTGGFTKEDIELYYELNWKIESSLYNKQQTDSLVILRVALETRGIIAGVFKDNSYIQSPKLYVSNLQAKIISNEYLVSVFSMKDKTFFFVLSGTGFRTIEVSRGKEQIEQMLSTVSYRFSSEKKQSLPVNSDLFAYHAGKANELYNKLFSDVFQSIPENAKVIFVPSEEFYSFPLELLVKSFDNNQSPYKYSGVDYLVNHYTLSTAPSAGIYIRLKQNRGGNVASSLIMGNPSFGNSYGIYAERRGLFDETPGVPRNLTLYPLKYSEDEIVSIHDKFGTGGYFNGKNATETNFKALAEKSGIIHLSTHSWLIGKQPVIFFSPESDLQNDGILEAGEVAKMKLKADLVALSSCNSGEGLHEASEGVIGMTKAFLDAGAASVVVSMWEVNDHYTAEFMKYFYTGLKDGKTKADALREAKLLFIKNVSPNPYYWSGFVLVGNTESLPSYYSSGMTGNVMYYILGGMLAVMIGLILARKKRESDLRKAREYIKGE